MRFHLLFGPAIRLMNRLDYRRKFAVFGGLVLLALFVLAHSLYSSLRQDIEAAEHELAGLSHIRTLSQIVQRVQKHRGLRAGELAGVRSMGAERQARAAETDALFDQIATQLPAGLLSQRDLFALRTDWERLRSPGEPMDSPANFDAHTRLIERLLNFEADVADAYGLTLDPDPASTYLIDSSVSKLPATIERLGRVRAYGVALLSAGHASPEQVSELSALVTELDSARKVAGYNIEKTGRYNPALQSEMSRSAVDIGDSLSAIVRLVRTRILSGPVTLSPEVFYRDATSTIDSLYAQIEHMLLPAAERLIRERLDGLRHALMLTMGMVSALLGVALYCSIGGYYAITRSVRNLAESARALADGRLEERIRLDSRDELAQIAGSFNDMAAGLSALIATRRDNEDTMRAIIDSALDAVVQMNEDGEVTGWNPRAEAIFGWTRSEALGQPMHALIVPPEYREAHVRGLRHFLATGSGPALNRRLTITGRHRDGHDIPIELTIAVSRVNGRHAFSAFIRDITEQRKAEELIWTQANYDVLTQLPNRRMFRDRLDQELLKANRSGRCMVLMFIDLDRFKEVNDAFGHQTGDVVLIEAARRIRSCVRESDTLARLGGDEFVGPAKRPEAAWTLSW